jgi:hypothetical protein
MNKRPSPSDLEILEAIHRRYIDGGVLVFAETLE